MTALPIVAVLLLSSSSDALCRVAAAILSHASAWQLRQRARAEHAQLREAARSRAAADHQEEQWHLSSNSRAKSEDSIALARR